MVEKMHMIFRIARKNITNQSAENRDRRNRNLKQETFEVGDLVYVYNKKGANKLHPKWLNGYVIVKKTSEFSFEVVDQLTQRTFKVHARNLRKAYPNDMWKNARQLVQGRPRRRARYVMTPSDTDCSGSSDSRDINQGDSNGQLIDDFRVRYRRMRQQIAQKRQEVERSQDSDMDSDDMHERLLRLRDEGDDQVADQGRGLKDIGTAS